MKSERRKFGDFGEGVALKFLENKGFSLVERNYWKPWGEIDLIVKKGIKYHFIEVKTGVLYETGENDVSYETIRPEDNIHPKKMEKVLRTVQTYCLEKNISEENISVDVVIVKISQDNKRVKVSFLEGIVL